MDDFHTLTFGWFLIFRVNVGTYSINWSNSEYFKWLWVEHICGFTLAPSDPKKGTSKACMPIHPIHHLRFCCSMPMHGEWTQRFRNPASESDKTTWAVPKKKMSQWVTLPLCMGWYGLRLRFCGPLSQALGRWRRCHSQAAWTWG